MSGDSKSLLPDSQASSETFVSAGKETLQNGGMSPGKRIRAARLAASITSQEALAGKIGVSRSAVNQWENDKTAPDREHMLLLAELFGTTYEWLATGSGEKARSSGVETVNDSVAGNASPSGGTREDQPMTLSLEEQRLISIYRRLGAVEKAAVVTMLDTMEKALGRPEVSRANPTHGRM